MTSTVWKAGAAVARAARTGDTERERVARADLAAARVQRELAGIAERGVRLDRDQAEQLHALVDEVTR